MIESKKLYSNILGEGSPFIILHGFLGMGDNWKTLGSQFAEQGYQVHLVDQRNHGRSFHDDDFSYETLSADLKRYCDAHQLSDIVLMGHSMGGKTAMLFAICFRCWNATIFIKKLILERKRAISITDESRCFSKSGE